MGYAHFPTKKHPQQIEVLPVSDSVVETEAGALQTRIRIYPYIDSGFEGTTFRQAVRNQRRMPVDRFRNTFHAEKIKDVQ